MKKRQSVGLISLGCAKNRVDSEIMLGELERQGHRIVADPANAEAVIVNTCGFIDAAKEESIDTILEVAALKAKGVETLWVAGCMANRYGEELAHEIPEIDGFISLDQLRDVGNLVSLGRSRPTPKEASHLVFDHTSPRVLTTRASAYLKVAEGCNNPCSFCAIPVWRGRFRSREIASLVAEAQALEAKGVRELCLLAQDTTRYGEDLGLGRHGLLRLAEALLAETTVPWIRFLYAYPTTLDSELLRLMGTEERFVSYLDIPFQHSHREILRAMRRGGSGEQYLERIAEARRWAPDIHLRTTFIVGFPGETERHFEHLVEFVEAARFDHLGVFLYSPEEDTPSAQLPDRPNRAVAEERRQRLLEVQEPISRQSRQRLVGQRLPVLLEGVCEETEHLVEGQLLEGRHAGQAPEVDGRVLINDGVPTGASLECVEITEAFADDLVGQLVSAAAPSVTSGKLVGA